MEENEARFTQDIYSEHLTTFNGIKFTPRQVDVIACLASMKGTKKIAELLSFYSRQVSPHTVRTHIQNIMQKLGCSSRESIIEFVETSQKVHILREYYSALVTEVAFEKSLKDISKLKREKYPACIIFYWQNQNLKAALINRLSKHLNLAGVNVEVREQELEQKVEKVESLSGTLLLFIEKKNQKDISEDLLMFDFLDLSERQNYYLSVFEVFKKIHPNINIENIIEEFKITRNFSGSKLIQTRNSQFVRQAPNIFIPFPSKDEEKLKFSIQSWGPFQEKCLVGGLPNWGNLRFLEAVPQGSPESYLIQVGNLLHQSTAQSLFPKTLTITGLGGIGKTSLALAYARLAEINGFYELIYWIKADKRFDIIQGYKRILTLLGEKDENQDEQEIIDHLRLILKDRKYLLIFDNILGPDELINILPEGQRGHSLITSRFSASGWDVSLTLDTFSPEESTHYLFTRTSYLEDELNQQHANGLAKKLAYLPLALAQAASFIEIRKCDFEQYIKEYEEKSIFVLGYKDKKGDYPYTIATTWLITMDEISKLTALPKKLMSYFAYLSPDNIPITLFKDLKLEDNSKIEESIDTLHLYSMIKRTKDNVSVHRLVQEVERIHQESNLQGQDIIYKLIDLLIKESKYLFNKSLKNRELFRKALIYFDHIMSVLEHAKRLNMREIKVQSFEWIAKILYYRLLNFPALIKLINEDKKNDEIRIEAKKLSNKTINIFYTTENNLFNVQSKINEKALEILMIELQPIHPKILVMVGGFFYFGQIVQQNYSKAYKWYEKAALQGYATAQFTLGGMLARGCGIKQNFKKAFMWYKRAALQGYAKAQLSLASMYANGQAVKQDDEKAFEWYEKAALQGHDKAQLVLGFMYAHGKGVEQNDKKALKWYKKAAMQGNTKAQLTLGWLFRTDNKEQSDSEMEFLALNAKSALRGNPSARLRLGFMHGFPLDMIANNIPLLEKAATQGVRRAQSILGFVYMHGIGLKQNNMKAFEWYEKAASQGHAPDQLTLGLMYAYGKGIERDDVKAFEWFKKASLQGHNQAQLILGFMYTYGKGVKQNSIKALEWYEKAALQKITEIPLSLGYSYVHAMIKNDVEIFEWRRKTALQGSPRDQSILGFMYLHGKGTEKSDKEAFKWFKKAAKQRDACAQLALGLEYTYGNRIARNDAKAFKWFEKAAWQTEIQSAYINEIREQNRGDVVKKLKQAMQRILNKIQSQINKIWKC